MLIVGARGFAKEIFEGVIQNNDPNSIAFFDDVNVDNNGLIYEQISILKNLEEVNNFFKKFGHDFTIGIGNPLLRFKLYQKFIKINGIYTSTISPDATISKFDVNIGNGSNVLSTSVISNSVQIGNGCIVYYGVIITHDCKVGEFVELSPKAVLLGGVEVGDFSHVGANATILPKIKVGKNVIIGAGAVVTKDLPDNCVAVGVPAKIIRQK